MKTPNKSETKLRLADLVEIGSDGTSIGKSTLATRTCHFYRETGRPVTLVRIKAIGAGMQRPAQPPRECSSPLRISSPPPTARAVSPAC